MGLLLEGFGPQLVLPQEGQELHGLSDYSYYLRNGGGELVNSLDDVRIGIVSRITGIAEAFLFSVDRPRPRADRLYSTWPTVS